jgi:hypothetical protein
MLLLFRKECVTLHIHAWVRPEWVSMERQCWYLERLCYAPPILTQVVYMAVLVNVMRHMSRL